MIPTIDDTFKGTSVALVVVALLGVLISVAGLKAITTVGILAFVGVLLLSAVVTVAILLFFKEGFYVVAYLIGHLRSVYLYFKEER